MSGFVLVHGAWHGGWCWERLMRELTVRGHRSVTVDLPSDVPSAGLQDYADVVAASVGEHDVVVGHSLAGLVLPLVAVKVRVRHLVYLCAGVPIPGCSYTEQLALEPDMLLPDGQGGLGPPDATGRQSWIDLGVARRVLYPDCAEVDADAALARLRPQAVGPYAERCALDVLPTTPSTYIACTEDRVANPVWARRVAAGRLGAAFTELPGGHSPFWSRPAALADVLADILEGRA